MPRPDAPVMTLLGDDGQTTGSADRDTRIRCMTPDDVEAVFEIEQQSFPDAWSRTLLFQQLKTEWGLNYVSVRNFLSGGGVCGYACGVIIHQECTLHKIACHQAYRHRGIASELVRHFITQALRRGATAFFLEVRASNRVARKLYEKFGFVHLSVRRRYYTESGEDALILKLDAGPGAENRGGQRL